MTHNSTLFAMSPVECTISPPGATLTLNDPDRRNAMSLAMFDALDAAVAELALRDDVIALHLRGNGPAFCAGFDLPAAVEDHALLATFIERLSALNRALRRGPQVVIASVHGAALAGGCALVSACDFVICTADVRLGYPVHRIGISPAVTIPTLAQALGEGHTRELLMSGRIIDGAEAHRIGLVTHLVADASQLDADATDLAARIASHGQHAVRVTRQWINELDGSLDDARFDQPMRGSADATESDETITMLQRFWESRSRSR